MGASKIDFIVDTGARLTVIPDKYARGLFIKPTPVSLYTATGDPIRVLGEADINIGIPSLNRVFPWTVVLASVTHPLLGMDFLKRYGLLLDCENMTVIDSLTNRSSKLNPSCSNIDDINLCFSIELPGNVKVLLDKYESLTSPGSKSEKKESKYYHRIDTNSSPPVFARPRKLSEDKLKVTKEIFKKLLEDGIVESSDSSWSSPLHLVPKATGEWRPCGDFRALNTLTRPDRYPIPNINNYSSKLHNMKCFSKIDLVHAFHQIPVHPDDRCKTAVTTPFGLFHFNYMPFGLKNASSSFQRFIDDVFRDFGCVFIYLDDILVYSPDEETHLRDLEAVFKRLSEFNLKISTNKCKFFVSEIDFLGCNISQAGIKPTSSKLDEITNFPCPNDSKSLRRFLGMCGFYRKLIKNYAQLVLPLSECIRLQPNARSIELDDSQRKCFHDILETLKNLEPLAHPHPDDNKLQLVTDSSQYAVGAALHQMIDGVATPIGFFSKKLSQPQKSYSAFDRELLAAYYSVIHFKHQIEGRDVLLFTDHKPLCSAFKSQNYAKSDRQQRHLSLLSEYINDICHIKGSHNIVADCLSRPTLAVSVDLFDLHSLAEQQKDDIEINDLKDRLKSYSIDKDIHLLCDTSTPYPRPYVPKASRKSIFDSLHSICHSGIKASLKLIKSRYFWPFMDKEIRKMCSECLSCQQAKTVRHTKSKVDHFSLPTERFQTIHIDIVGPLPPVKNPDNPYVSPYKYLLTCIDRCTRWIEAYPLSDITAATVAQAFFNAWISRFGVPLYVVTDRGSQFESELFLNLSKIIGFHRLRTCSYHPESNGVIERAHRTIKSAIMARKESWLTAFPVVLFGTRIIPNESNYSPFTCVTGTNILVPQLMLSDDDHEYSDDSVGKLIKEMTKLKHDFLSRGKFNVPDKSYVPKELSVCDEIWLRIDRVRKPLEAPYSGPFKVLHRTPKFFTIQLNNGNTSNVSINRLKPVITSKNNNVEPNNSDAAPSRVESPPIPDRDSTSDGPADEEPSVPIRTTRSGRKVTFKRNDEFVYY